MIMVRSWPSSQPFQAVIAWGNTPEEAQIELLKVFGMIREEHEEEGQMLPEDIDVKAVYACQS
jgi:hypothetical protein